MANTAPIPTQEPQSIVAGDTLLFTKDVPSYPASDGWTLSYVIAGPGGIFSFDATASGAVYSISVASTVTATWAAGLYSVSAYVTLAGQRFAVLPAFPTLTITGNPTTAAGSSVSTFAQQTLALIGSTITQLVQKTVSSASVNGQSYSLANIGELYKLRNLFQTEARNEEYQARLNAGLGASNKIKVRFGYVGGGYPTQNQPFTFR